MTIKSWDERWVDYWITTVTAAGLTPPDRNGIHWQTYTVTLLEQLVGNVGGVLPSESLHWSQRVERLLYNLVVAQGGTPIDGDGMHWNDLILQRLSEVSASGAGGGGSSNVSTAVLESTWTKAAQNDTLENVTGLSLTLTPGTWKIELIAHFQSSTAADGDVAFTFSGTSTSQGYVDAEVGTTYFTSWGSEIRLAGANGAYRRCFIDGYAVVTVEGTLQVQFAQGVTTAVDTTILAGALLRATKA